MKGQLIFINLVLLILTSSCLVKKKLLKENSFENARINSIIDFIHHEKVSNKVFTIRHDKSSLEEKKEDYLFQIHKVTNHVLGRYTYIGDTIVNFGYKYIEKKGGLFLIIEDDLEKNILTKEYIELLDKYNVLDLEFADKSIKEEANVVGNNKKGEIILGLVNKSTFYKVKKDDITKFKKTKSYYRPDYWSDTGKRDLVK